MILEVHVPGHAYPQGSKRHVGGGRMIEASPHLKAWRSTVVAHTVAEMIHLENLHETDLFPLHGPTTLTATFHFTRPRNHYRSGKLAELLRAVAPRDMSTGADLDKLVRAVGDALTIAGAIVDDRQINRIHAAKKWTTEPSYTSIKIEGTHQ